MCGLGFRVYRVGKHEGFRWEERKQGSAPRREKVIGAELHSRGGWADAPCLVCRLCRHLNDVVVGRILEVDGVAEGDFLRGARLIESVVPSQLHRRGIS